MKTKKEEEEDDDDEKNIIFFNVTKTKDKKINLNFYLYGHIYFGKKQITFEMYLFKKEILN